MATKKANIVSESLDVGAAERAFQQLHPDLARLDASLLRPVRADLQLSAAVAYSIATRDAAGDRREKLALVAQSGIFDLGVLDRLPVIALAAWYVRRRQLEATEKASAARVVETTLKEAQAIRTRMLRVLTHFFEEHAEYGKRIASIRAGFGYLDLANDLISLADFYEVPEVKSVVSCDPIYYRTDDPQHARELAQELFRDLGLTAEGDAARFTDLAQRAWTLLSQHYDALRAAGHLVFRNEENVRETYPSLVSAVRAPATRVIEKPATPQPEPAAETTET
jgi:hypothetical protein